MTEQLITFAMRHAGQTLGSSTSSDPHEAASNAAKLVPTLNQSKLTVALVTLQPGESLPLVNNYTAERVR